MRTAAISGLNLVWTASGFGLGGIEIRVGSHALGLVSAVEGLGIAAAGEFGLGAAVSGLGVVASHDVGSGGLVLFEEVGIVFQGFGVITIWVNDEVGSAVSSRI